jgi:hypothetical protein
LRVAAARTPYSRNASLIRFYVFVLLALSTVPNLFWAQPQGPPLSPCPTNPLTPEAEQIAELIGIAGQVRELRAISCQTSSASVVDQLVLRQKITDTILIAFFDVDEVVARIDHERAQMQESRGLLLTQKSRSVNLLLLANIITGTGSWIITNDMQFSTRTAMAEDGIGVGGGAAEVFLSTLGLRVRGGKALDRNCAQRAAELFGRLPEPHSVYPPYVWAGLTTKPSAYPKLQMSWREELIDQWVRRKRVGPPDGSGSQKKISLLSSSIAEHTPLPLELLADRSLMLLDVRGRVALMQGALRDLLVSVSQQSATAAGRTKGRSGCFVNLSIVPKQGY